MSLAAWQCQQSIIYYISSSDTAPPRARLLFLFSGLPPSWLELLEPLSLFVRLSSVLLFWFSFIFEEGLITRPDRLLWGVVKVETYGLSDMEYCDFNGNLPQFDSLQPSLQSAFSQLSYHISAQTAETRSRLASA